MSLFDSIMTISKNATTTQEIIQPLKSLVKFEADCSMRPSNLPPASTPRLFPVLHQNQSGLLSCFITKFLLFLSDEFTLQCLLN